LASAASSGVGLGRWFGRRAGRPRRTLPQPSGSAEANRGGESLADLRDAIVGNGKQEIASVFGPPRSAAIQGAADTWYYPLRKRERLAMAIQFDKGLAREVEFFHPPAKTQF